MKTKLLLTTAVLALVISALFAWRQFSGPRMNLRPSAAVGEVLAEEISRLPGNGGKVVIIGRAAAMDGQSAAGEQIASLTSALKSRATKAPQLVATEWLPAAPGAMMDLGGIGADQLAQLIQKHRDANSFIVFAGLPPFSPALAQTLTGRSVKLVAVCGYSANLRKWLESRAVVLAAVPRLSELPAATPEPKGTWDWFAREFEMLTPETTAKLPY